MCMVLGMRVGSFRLPCLRSLKRWHGHGDMLCGCMGQWLGVSATRTQGCPTRELAPLVPAASDPMTGV